MTLSVSECSLNTAQYLILKWSRGADEVLSQGPICIQHVISPERMRVRYLLWTLALYPSGLAWCGGEDSAKDRNLYTECILTREPSHVRRSAQDGSSSCAGRRRRRRPSQTSSRRSGMRQRRVSESARVPAVQCPDDAADKEQGCLVPAAGEASFPWITPMDHYGRVLTSVTPRTKTSRLPRFSFLVVFLQHSYMTAAIQTICDASPIHRARQGAATVEEAGLEGSGDDPGYSLIRRSAPTYPKSPCMLQPSVLYRSS